MTNPVLAFLFLLVGTSNSTPIHVPTITQPNTRLESPHQTSKTPKKTAAPKKATKTKTPAKPTPKASSTKTPKPTPPAVTQATLPVEPLALTGKAADAKAAYDKEDFAKAASLLAEYRKANPNDPNHYELGYLQAKALSSAKKTSDAISLLEGLSAQNGPLSSEVFYSLATLYQSQNKPQKAKETYSKVERGSRRYDAARLARANLASDLAECDQILAERFYWTKDRAEALAIQKKFAQKEGNTNRANEISISLFQSYPNTPEGDAVVSDVLALKPGHDVLIKRLDVLLSKKKSSEAKSYVKFLEHTLGEKDPVVIEANGDLAFLAKDWPEAIELFVKAQKNNEDSARAMRRQANALARKGDTQDALDLYQKVYEGKSNEVQRALLDAAKLLRELDKPADARKLAQRAADEFTSLEYRKEALWAAGWLAWRDDDFVEAATRFDALVSYTESLGPAEREAEELERRKMGFHAKERGLYWAARAYTAQKKEKEATSRYETIVIQYPLSYYSHQAFNRLEELGAANELRVRQKDAKTLSLTTKTPEDKNKKGPTWTTPEAPKGGFSITNDPSVRAAVALYSLGFVNEAIDELKSQANQETLSTDGGAFLGALALNKDGVTEGTWTLLWKWDFARYPGEPNGDTAGEKAQERLVDLGWKIAFPRAYGEIVDQYSKKFDVPDEMVLAIMRAESTFRPEVVSPANAVGLTQVLPTTATWIAKELLNEPKPSRSQLFDEETNIKLGSRFMKELLTLFDGNYALAIASYNAGPGAGMRWYKKWNDSQTDELIEEIPFQETHGYTKKVLGSLGAYRYVWDDWTDPKTRSIELSQALPKKLGTYNGKQM